DAPLLALDRQERLGGRGASASPRRRRAAHRGGRVMARIALNPPDAAHRPQNTGDSAEFGDSFKTIVSNINLMTTELFAGVQLADGATAIKPSGNISDNSTTIGLSA